MKRSLETALLAACLLVAPKVAAQGLEPLPQHLYLNPAVLIGSNRIVSLGGAYVAIAEGTSSFTSNLAALAHRAPRLERSWDVGVTVSLLDLPLSAPRDRDLDNDGVADRNESSAQFLAGLMLQLRQYGLGAYVRGSGTTVCLNASCDRDNQLDVTLNTSALAAAMALDRDQFIIAFGLYAASATFTFQGEQRRYAGTGVSFDLLYRPEARPYRIGVSVKPQVIGSYLPEEGAPPLIAGRRLFSALASPAVLSMGYSLKFGKGSENFNRLSPIAHAEVVQEVEQTASSRPAPPSLPLEAPMGSLLLSFQVDLLSPVDNAVALPVFTEGVAPERIGNAMYLVPRFGAEHDTLPGRLRLRAGTYIEPSPFPGRPPRPHLTGGLEVFVLRYWEDWAVSASVDVASRYYNVGFSLGFWR